MTLWSSNSANSAHAPKYKILDNKAANGQTMFANTTNGAFIPGEVVSIDGKPSSNVTANHNITSPGWIKTTFFAGPVSAITITAPGTAYANTDTVKVSGGSVNAAATITTNGSGVITAVTITTPGSGFTNTASSTLAITTSTGSGATLAFTLGGRAGRIQYETLVEMSSMT